MKILSEAKIKKYTKIELADPERQKPAPAQRPWVLGNMAYRDRICDVLRWCLKRFDGNVLEIGTYGGNTTTVMADVAKTFGRVVVTVDPFNTDGPRGDHFAEVYKDFLRCSKEYLDSGLIEFIRGLSEAPEVVAQICKCRYAFTFVDGEHIYKNAFSDTLLAMDVTNGIICCHDWWYPGVRRAVPDALRQNPGWEIVLERDEFSEIYLGRS